MRRILPLLPLLIATQAHAQSARFEGSVSASAASGDNSTLALDFTAGIPLTRSSSIPLGFEIGTYFFLDEDGDPHETYAAFTWGDALRLGVVRPAYDLVLPSVFETLAPGVARDRVDSTRSHATTKAMSATAIPYGLSFVQDNGSLFWAVSAHDAETGDFKLLSAALRYTAGPWELAGAVEQVWRQDGDDIGTDAKLGVNFDFGAGQLGLAYLSPDANDTPDLVSFSAGWNAGSRMTVSTFGELAVDEGTDAYGIGADYSLSGASSLLGSVVKDNDDTQGYVGVQYRF